jgi:prepilin-type N-terminal cleavage/methylation domain-containing protein
MAMRQRRQPPATSNRAPAFTLVELLIVMVVIGILLALVLRAAMGSIRDSEIRQTQALIAKLDAGLVERIDAVLSTRVDANDAHAYLAGIWSTLAPPPPPFPPLPSNSRAQLLARIEQIKAELPDVFVIQGDSNYPLNFAALPYVTNPGSSATAFVPSPYANYLIPIGSGILNDPSGAFSGTPSFGANPPGGASATNPAVPPPSTGIFGASYAAAAGIIKKLSAAAIADTGAVPPAPANAGYDGVDNNGNGLVDELTENDNPKAAGVISAAMLARLGKHTHKTARAEMLYALLVEGQGPFGSVFSPDDFTDREVKDTDGDGLPEFVDAWGEPLQFYRWPIGYWFSDNNRDVQKGLRLYSSALETREQNPLDPNQSLVDPAWWEGAFNNSNSPFGGTAVFSAATYPPLSGPAYFAQCFFGALTDPNAPTATLQGTVWDRGPVGGATWGRRAFYCKALILSGGPDKLPGVPVLDPAYWIFLGGYTNLPALPSFGVGGSVSFPIGVPSLADDTNITYLQVENQAAPVTPARSSKVYLTVPTDAGSQAVLYAIGQARGDDITNQNLSAPGGATQ